MKAILKLVTRKDKKKKNSWKKKWGKELREGDLVEETHWENKENIMTSAADVGNMEK